MVRNWGAVALAVLLPLAVLGVLGGADWLTVGQPLLDAGLLLPPGGVLREAITIQEAGLQGIDVDLSRNGPRAGHVALRLSSDGDGRDLLASAELPAARIDDTSQPIRQPFALAAFRFTALDLAPGQRVWLWLESDADGPLVVHGLASRTEEATWLNGRPAKMLVRAQLHYRRSVAANLALFGERLTANRPGLLGRPWLYLALLVGFAAVLAATLAAMRD